MKLIILFFGFLLLPFSNSEIEVDNEILYVILVKDDSNVELGYFTYSCTQSYWAEFGRDYCETKATNRYGSKRIKIAKIYPGKCAVVWSQSKDNGTDYYLAEGYTSYFDANVEASRLRKRNKTIEEVLCN